MTTHNKNPRDLGHEAVGSQWEFSIAWLVKAIKLIETSKRVPHDESIVSGERKGRGRNAVGGGPMNGLTNIIESLRLG